MWAKLAALAATIAIPVGIFAAGWGIHHQQVTEFRSAKKGCMQSLSDVVVELSSAAEEAHRIAFTESEKDILRKEFWNSINEAQVNRFNEPFNLRENPHPEIGTNARADFYWRTEVLRSEWLLRGSPSEQPGVSKEEVGLRSASEAFNAYVPMVHDLTEPSFMDSIHDLFSN